MEEKVEWNVAVANLAVEAERQLMSIRSDLVPTDSETKLLAALACLDQMKLVLAKMPKMVPVDELTALPDKDLVRIFGGAFQALQTGKYPGAERAMLTVFLKALAHNPDLARDICEAFPLVCFDEPENWGIADPDPCGG